MTAVVAAAAALKTPAPIVAEPLASHAILSVDPTSEHGAPEEKRVDAPHDDPAAGACNGVPVQSGWSCCFLYHPGDIAPMARRGPRRNAGRTCSPECPTPPVRRPPRTSSRIGASIGLSQKGRHNGKHPALHFSAGSPDRHLRPLPSRGHARRDIPATSVADHASSVWSVVTTLLFNLLCADPSGQRERVVWLFP